MKLHQDGRGYSTLASARGVVEPAFQIAYNEDIIRKNPFTFRITDVVPNDSKKRESLTEDEQKLWMTFIKTDKTYSKYYDEFVVLLETGLRVSEFCGLTISDLDFEGRGIRVDHQLVRERGGKYYVERTKTESGRHYVPMSDDTYNSLQKILEKRPKVQTEMMVDGYTGFLLWDKNQRPKVALHIENEVRWARKKYNKFHPDKPLPHITPHVYRHTFCTGYAYDGMHIKNLRYLMGHSDARITMNVYTHSGYEQAAEQLTKVIRFRKSERAENQIGVG